MKSPQLQGLMTKLNPLSRRTLENAAGFCLRKTQYTVEIEHWLFALLQENDSQCVKILQHYHVNIPLLSGELEKILKTYKRGNDQAPALSDELVNWVSEAWSIASLELNATEIQTGYLLYALFSSQYRQNFTHRLTALDNISKDDLSTHFLSLIKNYSETSTNIPIAAIEKNSALTQFTLDLTEQARLGKLDPVIGRDGEIRQLIDILMRRRQNNPLLVGEAGVGKTAIAEGLALKIIQGEVPHELKNVSLRMLDLALLQAGAGIKGEFELRLKNLIAEINQSPVPIILFIDEAHTLIGAGAQAGQGDAANLLKPALARGELRTIAATTWSEYKKYIEKDPALTRRFQLLSIQEPDIETAVQILTHLKPLLEKYHQIKINDDVLVAAVNLSKRYLLDRQLPDKAVSLLDTACAKVHIDQLKTVTVDIITSIISDWTSIPVNHLVENEIDEVLHLKERLQKRIQGQPKAIEILSNAIQISSARLNDPQRPMGVFLLLGDSGVGKTETAHVLSELVFGDEQALITLNMSEFKEPYKISMLTGSPAGYVGYGEGGIFTEAVRRRPYSVILLDEMDKAHSSVQDVFYQVFDKGMLRDGEGRWIDFKNTLILMTANNSDAFKTAFMARMTVVPYLPLDTLALDNIIKQQLESLGARIKQHYDARLNYNAAVVNHIRQNCEHHEEGARHINKSIQQEILPMLSSGLLQKSQMHQKIKTITLFVTRAKKLDYKFGLKK